MKNHLQFKNADFEKNNFKCNAIENNTNTPLLGKV